MIFKKLKTDRGVAGTTVLLSLIVSLFVIGLLVMIFALMGSSLRDASYDATTVAVTNETGAWINSTAYNVSTYAANGFTSLTLTHLYNSTDGTVIELANATVSGIGFTNSSSMTWSNVSASYTYVYDAENTATEVINETTTAISGATDFFDLFIVIGSMVVLILLTVIIIVAIRNSGMMEGTA